jgi:hypothetical protein
MKLFCKLFGHTWIPETRVPSVRWNTTKEGHVLNPTIGTEPTQHLEVCRRCNAERPAPPRRHDADRPTLVASATGDEHEAE